MSKANLIEKQKKTISRDVGLEIAATCGKYFLKLEHLHYGYWSDGLEIDISNLHIAQENYANFLVSHIPEGVKTVLDVGCGLGRIARKLIDMGYKVDCVSPSPFLSEQARSLLGDASRIFECRYELLDTEKRYDLVLFSESFQYIHLEKALEKSLEFLNDDGWLLISDFFKKDVEGGKILKGGHKLKKFYEVISQYPFEIVEDLDITEETAPNLDILDDAMKKVVDPVLHSGLRLLNSRYPLTSKILQWKYRKKINKINEKYLGGAKTGENFKKFKSYRLFLCKKTSASTNE